MSNDDFWTSLATSHTNTVLAGAMDSHLSGKSIDESFGSVRTLTDIHRQANALSLPVEAGTKVVFAGGLGAVMSYDDVPADGITGEVVTVKSATGEITHHGGKVFVKWADGKFRPTHAEHLRLASGKTASGEMAVKQVAGKLLNDRTVKKHLNFSKDLEGGKVKKIRLDDGMRMLVITLADQYPGISFFVEGNKGGRRNQILAQSRGGIPAHGSISKVFSPIMKAVEEWLEEGETDLLKAASVPRKKMENAIAGKMPPDSKRGRGANRVIMLTGNAAKAIGKDNYSTHKMADLSDEDITTLYNLLVLRKRASDIKAQFEKIKAMAEKRADSKFLKSLLKQMADKGFAPTEKQMAVVKKIEEEIKQQSEMKKELKGLDKGAGFDASTIGERKGKPVQMDDEDKDTVGNFGQGEHHDMTDAARGKNATFRVASLGDLSEFLKVANGALVHKSTKDLWSYSKDADGNFLVSRLFDDEGEPLKV